jgi:hypothetical protein
LWKISQTVSIPHNIFTAWLINWMTDYRMNRKKRPSSVSKPRVAACSLLVLWTLSAASVSLAIAGGKVNVGVEVIYASNQPRPTERSLSYLKNQLRSTFNFASYTLLAKREMTLSKGRSGRTSIPGGKYLKIELEDVRGERARLMVRITDRRRQILSTMFSVSPGQTVLLGGPAYMDGSLIIAIRAGF